MVIRVSLHYQRSCGVRASSQLVIVDMMERNKMSFLNDTIYMVCNIFHRRQANRCLSFNSSLSFNLCCRCIGVGLKDPALIKSLWHMTIFGFFVDTLLCAAFPIAVCFQGIRLAWYFWLWLICPLIYVPYIASYTCEMIFSYYRVLDMGGTGAELASPADLEALLLPDRQGSLASGNT